MQTIIKLVGLGDFGPDVDIDSDPDVEIDGGLGSVGFADGLVSIIGMGRVPFTIWLACLLMVFSGIGFGIQALAEGLKRTQHLQRQSRQIWTPNKPRRNRERGAVPEGSAPRFISCIARRLVCISRAF